MSPRRRRSVSAAERTRRSERMKTAWAAGKFAGRKRARPMPDAWDPEQDRALSELAGTLPVPELAAALSARFGIARTPAACRIRARRIGLSLWARGLSLIEVEAIFGLDHRAILRNWVGPGLLIGTRWSGRGPHAGWWFEPAAVERFVRACPWAYDWERMRKGRWRSLAEVANRADPWLPAARVRAYLGISDTNLTKWLGRGLPHRRRYGAGGKGQVMVRAKDLPTIGLALERVRAASIARRDRLASRRMRAAARDGRGRVLPAERKAAAA